MLSRNVSDLCESTEQMHVIPITPMPVPAPSFTPGPTFEGLTQSAGPNDGGVKRGDREEAGDNQADLDEMGSGPAQPTADPTSLGSNESMEQSGSSDFDSESELQESEGFEIVQADDGRLGLTGLSDQLSDDDPIAGTGATRNSSGH